MDPTRVQDGTLNAARQGPAGGVVLQPGQAGAHLPAGESQRHYGPELVYRKQIRPVVDNDATVVDRSLRAADQAV